MIDIVMSHSFSVSWLLSEDDFCIRHMTTAYRGSIASRGKNWPAAYSNKMIYDKKY